LAKHTDFGSEELLENEKGAREVIKACRTDRGFNASTHLYHQLWLRDLVYSEDSLLRMGYQQDIEKHFSEFIALQRSTGQMPTVIDYSPSKIIRQRYQRCPSDAEILFVIGMNKLAAAGCNDFFDENLESINLCLKFIENKLDSHRLIAGMDWRDAMPVYIGKYLLANQMLLADMYELQGNLQASNLVKENVNKFFYCRDLGWYADSIHWSENELKIDRHFDSLGNALAILNGTASKEDSENMLKGFNLAKTPFGYRNIMPYYEFNREKALATWYKTCRVPFGVFLRNRIDKYQNSAIWPFVEIRVIDALKKLQANTEAKEATNIMIKRRNFNELYDPTTGAPKGSKGQLWTAAAALMAINYFRS
jgi:hypothetical protein